jgi:hypothetical protein
VIGGATGQVASVFNALARDCTFHRSRAFCPRRMKISAVASVSQRGIAFEDFGEMNRSRKRSGVQRHRHTDYHSGSVAVVAVAGRRTAG